MYTIAMHASNTMAVLLVNLRYIIRGERFTEHCCHTDFPQALWAGSIRRGFQAITSVKYAKVPSEYLPI